MRSDFSQTDFSPTAYCLELYQTLSIECPSSIFSIFFWHVYFVIVSFFCRFCLVSLYFFVFDFALVGAL